MFAGSDRRRRREEDHRYDRPLTKLAVDFDLGAMALRNAVDHSEAEAGAPLALGREEGLETMATGFFAHAGTGVGDFDADGAFAFFVLAELGAHGDRAALGHGVDGVQDQIDERL